MIFLFLEESVICFQVFSCCYKLCLIVIFEIEILSCFHGTLNNTNLGKKDNVNKIMQGVASDHGTLISPALFPDTRVWQVL